MILEGIKNLYKYFTNFKGELVNSNSPLINFDGKKLIINDDIEIIIKGNLKIKTEKHMILKTSKLESNDEYEVYSIHLNPSEEKYISIGESDE